MMKHRSIVPLPAVRAVSPLAPSLALFCALLVAANVSGAAAAPAQTSAGTTAEPGTPEQGTVEEGQAKSTACIACHGVDGNSSNPQWPNIAGQHATYLTKQLQAFRSGARKDPLMTPMAVGLSDEDIADLAAYFAAQKLTGLEADPDKVDLGQRLYLGGDAGSGVPACAGCHGPGADGNPPALFPLLHGQHAVYIATQLKAYRAGTRQTDQNQMMRDVAGTMTDEQMEAVASYIQGLR